jgi:hypothetical protein
MSRSLAVTAFCLTAALGPAVPPAGADWLVTREGGRIETRGAWEVKGRLVVFRAADGSLSSLRLADVDLEASRKATGEAAQARTAEARPAAAERRTPVRSITDKDVRQAAAAAKPAATPDSKDSEKPAEPAAAAPSGLAVASWQRSQDGAGGSVVVTGMVQNASPGTAGDIKLTVILYDEAGTPLRAVPAALTATALPPGQQAEFRAEFPDIFGFASLRFDLKSPTFATAGGAASNGG